MTNYEDHPIKSEMRDKLLTDLARLALENGEAQMEGIEVTVEIIEKPRAPEDKLR